MSHLGERYETPGANGEAPFSTAIGLSLPSVLELVRAIDGDLDTNVHGVGWWAGYRIGDRRRILISDHLLQCARGVQVNMVDAQMHRLSLEHCDDEERRVQQHMVSLRPVQGGLAFDMQHPVRTNAQEDLPRVLGDLHRVGFFRAIGSALDCLGTVLVGVMAVPIGLVASDLGKARRWLRRLSSTPIRSPGGRMQAAFSSFLEAAIADAGPEDWLPWTLGARNMYVHRARRLQLSTVTPRKTGIIGHDGVPQVLSEVTQHLARSPLHSDVEVLSASAYDPVLNEDASTTIAGVFKSAAALIEAVSAGLTRAWHLRRRGPALLEQPLVQWKTPAPPASRFAGYAPGSRPFGHNAMLTNPEVVRRLRVAALDDPNAQKWKTMT